MRKKLLFYIILGDHLTRGEQLRSLRWVGNVTIRIIVTHLLRSGIVRTTRTTLLRSEIVRIDVTALLKPAIIRICVKHLLGPETV